MPSRTAIEKGKEIEDFLQGIVLDLKMQENMKLRTDVGYLNSGYDVGVDILLLSREFGCITIYWRHPGQMYEINIYTQVNGNEWISGDFKTFEECKQLVMKNYQKLIDAFKIVYYEDDEDDY